MLELPPDITYYLEIVAFLVFALILRQLIFVPMQEVLARREQRTSGAQTESAKMREEADAMRARLARTLEDARHEGSQAGAQVRREAEDLERSTIEQARSEAAAVLSEIRARVSREAEGARASLRGEADRIARLAAEKILGRPLA
jgi:F-type H+-transporting ATPase subunit b